VALAVGGQRKAVLLAAGLRGKEILVAQGVSQVMAAAVAAGQHRLEEATPTVHPLVPRTLVEMVRARLFLVHLKHMLAVAVADLATA
jgi:hypothetical protein